MTTDPATYSMPAIDNSTDLEAATPSVSENGTAIPTGNGNTAPPRVPRKLSSVSKMYDVNGDGQLDEAEMAMRGMDSSDRGFLTNDKIYSLVREQLETRRQLFRIKWIVFG